MLTVKNIIGEQTEKQLHDFDLNSSIFVGCEVEQKFTSKLSYEPKFVWVNAHTRTIHMSQYMTKERRHKEASLEDVTSIEIGMYISFFK